MAVLAMAKKDDARAEEELKAAAELSPVRSNERLSLCRVQDSQREHRRSEEISSGSYRTGTRFRRRMGSSSEDRAGREKVR